MGGTHTKVQKLTPKKDDKCLFNSYKAQNKRVTNGKYYHHNKHCNDEFKSNLRDEIVNETIKLKTDNNQRSSPYSFKFSSKSPSSKKGNDFQSSRRKLLSPQLNIDVNTKANHLNSLNNDHILCQMTSVDQKMSITNKNSKKNDTSLQQMKINEFTINSSVSNKQKSSYVSHMNRNQSDLCSGDENLSRQIDNLPKIATLNDTIPLVTKLNTDERNKISFEFVHKQSSGDTCTNKKMYTNPNRPSLQSCINAHLSNKPPTPPQKVHISRVMIPVSQRLNKSIRSSYNGKSPEVSTHQPRRSRSPKIHCGTNSSEHRSSYMPRPLSADPRSHSSVEASSPPVRLLKPITQQPENESGQEKSHCLARIEYTFYINDTESYQRPFYDRRVEAIARASQCSIFLHKPLPGNKPILYKGMRVLPVTIFARTMLSLKRCLARLDMQYPYFNVKAFCPPDMY